MAALFVLCVISVILFALYQFSKRKFNYWKKQKVPYLDPVPIVGNFKDYILLKEFMGQVEKEICEKFPKAPYVGAFYGTEPALIVKSPELLKLITTKDYYYFNSREISKYTHKEVSTQSIFFTYGDRWKVLRQNLTPLFSSSKMRNMFHLIEKCAHQFENLLDEEVTMSNIVEMRSLAARYTMDCTGACSFGVDTNAMSKDENNPFRRMGNLAFEISNIRGLSLIGRAIWPAVFYGLRLKVFPTELDEFFNKVLGDVFRSRNYEASARNDFVDMILNLKKNKYITGDSFSNIKDSEGNAKKISLEVTDELLVAQCLSLFEAGFETSASTMAFTLYELAKDPESQQKAFEEVDAYLKKHENHLGYECVAELPYLEACVDETLRLYPVLSVLTREVVEDYTLPDGVFLKKGVRVHIPVYYLQRNPEYFPDPEVFRPERFLPENKKNITPYTYMPFGEGPRICIGLRFAKMQTLAGLVTVLKKYFLELGPGVPRTLHFDPRGFVTTSKELLELKLIPRDGWEQRVLA